MILTILTFIIILAILIFVHELGHFLVAKKSGMQVDEFGFGFPPRIAGIQKTDGKWKWVWGHRQPMDQNQTIYSINWIPLGGFVRILGENNEHENNPKSFINRPFSGRLATLIAGVAMNFLLAWILITAVYGGGMPVTPDSGPFPNYAKVSMSKPVIEVVESNSPAQAAGLRPNDEILGVDGQSFNNNIDNLTAYINSHKGQTFNFDISRAGQEMHLEVGSRANPALGQGATGIAIDQTGKLQFPWYIAPWEGLKSTVEQSGLIFVGLYQLFTTKTGIQNLGGPVKIAQLTGQVEQMGFVYLVEFTAFLSVNLAVLNILPFPALDGGRILFLLIEKIRGKRNNQNLEQILNTAGFAFLILLMIAVTFHDIFSHFG